MRHVEILLERFVGSELVMKTVGMEVEGKLLYVGTGYVVLEYAGTEVYVLMDKIYSFTKKV